MQVSVILILNCDLKGALASCNNEHLSLIYLIVYYAYEHCVIITTAFSKESLFYLCEQL